MILKMCTIHYSPRMRKQYVESTSMQQNLIHAETKLKFQSAESTVICEFSDILVRDYVSPLFALEK
jgi:hypothetical protein